MGTFLDMFCPTREEAFRAYRVLLEMEKMQKGENGYIIHPPDPINRRKEILYFLLVASIPVGYIIVSIILRFFGIEL